MLLCITYTSVPCTPPQLPPLLSYLKSNTLQEESVPQHKLKSRRTRTYLYPISPPTPPNINDVEVVWHIYTCTWGFQLMVCIPQGLLRLFLLFVLYLSSHFIFFYPCLELKSSPQPNSSLQKLLCHVIKTSHKRLLFQKCQISSILKYYFSTLPSKNLEATS